VNDSARLAISDTQTDSDRGETDICGALQQEDRHEDDARCKASKVPWDATSPEPYTTAAGADRPLDVTLDILDDDVLLSTRMPTASAKPRASSCSAFARRQTLKRMAVMIEMESSRE